jgi:ferrous iron transport protein B
MDNEPVSLITLREGEEGIVHVIQGGERLTSRLAGMGMVPGVKIKILRNTAGAVIAFASETRVALGRREASRIQVKLTHVAPKRRSFLVALAGQPNVGKSTVFNILTGLSQHVGNWPGKTVEKKEGVHVSGDTELRMVDLPGTYSLTAFSEEERVAREFIINEHPDVIVLLVNAAALERSLYLLSELLLLDPPIIVAVNMLDVAQNQGVHIDMEGLQESLGIPVVPIVATKNRGIKELLSMIFSVAEGKVDFEPHLPRVSLNHQAIFFKVLELVRIHVPPLYTERWVAIKLMEGDPEVTELMQARMPEGEWAQVTNLFIEHEDALRAVVGGRYDWVEEVTRAAISRFKHGQVLLTDHIDHVLTQPILGVPILIGMLGLVFLLTYRVGFPVQSWLEGLMGWLAQWTDGLLASSPYWLRGVIVNGIIGGAGSVLTFFPILLIFFICLTLLEDVGYMARAAFVMDRFMHIVGLHGKSFLPICMGFGCNVASVLGARIVESRKARILTIFLSPFVPCTARLAVLTFVTAAVFGPNGSLVSWGLVSANIIILGLAGIVINKGFLRGEPTPFIMELPLYHKPDPKTIMVVVWNRMVAFVKKAGTIIVLVSILVWILSNVPSRNVEQSLLAIIGRTLAPIGSLLGLGWQEMVALLSSLVAKENSIATLSVLYGVGEEGLRDVLPRVMSHASALAFLTVLMLFVPCVATISVMKREMGSWRWFLASILTTLIVSFLAGVLAYHVAVWIKL